MQVAGLQTKTPKGAQLHMGKKHLTLELREILARLRSEGMSIRAIARIIDYSPSAICQELQRNKLKNGEYRPRSAQEKTRLRRLRANRSHLQIDPDLELYLKEKLSSFWSPEQIEGRLKIDFPHSKRMRICFKSIYNKICPYKGAPRSELTQYKKFLRRKHAQTRSFRHGKHRNPAEVNRCLRSIEKRPQVVDEKTRFGDWEGDLIWGKKGTGYIATFVERLTGLTLAEKCDDKSKQTVGKAIERFMLKIPPHLRKTMTLDRGTEFYDYERLEAKYSTTFYFCHPQCPHERGLNENINGQLRQYFPRKSNFRELDQAEINKCLKQFAARPRKGFGYISTMEKLQQLGLDSFVQF